jgi:transcriptional regulator with XRE-family HTH domain
MPDISETIKSARKSKRLTQLQLAKSLDPPVSACYISQIENGYYTSPNPEIVRQIGIVLGIKVVGDVEVGDDPFADLTDFERRALVDCLRKLRAVDPISRLKAGKLVLKADPDVDELAMNAFALAKNAAMRVLVWDPDDNESEPETGWVITEKARYVEQAWLWAEGIAVQSDKGWYQALRLTPRSMDYAMTQIDRDKEAMEARHAQMRDEMLMKGKKR